MENVLLDPMFESPQSSIRYVLITKGVVEGKEVAEYFSRAEKWKFDQVFSDEENVGVKSTKEGSRKGGIEEEESHGAAEREAEEREKEKHERHEKRRRKLAAA